MERILITVKTYPTLSAKYGELVCTAGLREDGSWIRIYPVPFRLLDAKGRESTMMIEDWEIGALYWNCLKDDVTPQEAVAKVRQMYFDNFRSKDLYLYLGTTREWHGRGRNPFVVIGAFYPPFQPQGDLFL